MGRGGRNSQDGMMQRQRQAAAQITTHRRRHGQDLQETRRLTEGQAPVYERNAGAMAGPGMPVAEAPAKKHRQKLGKVKKKERSESHSDVQRMAFKRNLLENVAMDEKGGYSQIFQDMLRSVKAYAMINVTGDARGIQGRELLAAEQEHLSRAMETIRGLHQMLEAEKNQGMEWGEEKERELRTLQMYENYFSLDTSGYLETPQEAEDVRQEDRRVMDCTGKTLTGTYKVWEQREENGRMVNEQVEKSIVMKEVPRDMPLFPHEPSLNDVTQGGLGDCYLLAALSAVINRDPQLIKDCMKDNGDGSVTVRLFKYMAKADGSGNELVPHYVKVKKAVPEGQPYASGSLWVQLIEHAYAASGFHKNRSGTNYNEIAGGDAGKFIQTITGRTAVTRTISQKNPTPEGFVMALQQHAALRIHAANPSSAGNISAVEMCSLIFPLALTQEQEADRDLYMMQIQAAYAQHFAGQNQGLYTIEEMRDYVNALDYRTLPEISGLTQEQNLLIKEGFVKALKDLYLDEATTTLNHKAFSGKYTPYAVEIFEQIQKAQEEGKIMTASTLNKFRSQQSGAGLNGEGMEMGLASEHVYTLLGVKQMDNNRYVMLRNPWGIGIRAYERDTKTGVINRERKDEGTHGIFLLELNEFLDHFEDMNFQ